MRRTIKYGIQHRRSDAQTLEKRLNLLEARQDAQFSQMEDLEYRLNIKPFEKNLDEILNYVRTAFRELNFVYEVRYFPREDNVFEITILHEMENRATALTKIFSQFMKIEKMFANTSLRMECYHKDDVRSDQLVGTKIVFSQARPKHVISEPAWFLPGSEKQ